MSSGRFPLPYEPKVMGEMDEPEEGTISCSRQVSPLLKRIESPAEKLRALTWAMVCHGVLVEVPFALSLPELLT
jgi:hypothetical protein